MYSYGKMLLSMVWEFGRMKDNSTTRAWPKSDGGFVYRVFHMQSLHSFHFMIVFTTTKKRKEK